MLEIQEGKLQQVIKKHMMYHLNKLALLFLIMIGALSSYGQKNFDIKKWKQDTLGLNGYRYSQLLAISNKGYEIFDEDEIKGKTIEYIENRYGEADEKCDLGSQLNLHYYMKGFEKFEKDKLTMIKKALNKCEKIDVKTVTKITLIFNKDGYLLSSAIMQSGG